MNKFKIQDLTPLTLLTPDKPDSCSLLMKHLGQRYVQYINKTYRRSGTLWEGRFKSCLIQEDTYFLSCSRYIELNPVRASMVNDPSDYPWSSYRTNGLGEPQALLTPHHLYRQLSSTDKKRQTAYRKLFKAHLTAEIVNDIREATNGNYALGNSRFKDEIETMLKRRARRGKPGRPVKEASNAQAIS